MKRRASRFSSPKTLGQQVRSTDVFTRAKRSEVMSGIRSGGNLATELALIAVFRLEGIVGWRRNTNLFGRPDFVFPEIRLAVLVDGCFWHSCPKHATKPKGNAAFWAEKLSGNRRRDRIVNRTLRSNGWRVCRIWEHELAPRRIPALRCRLRRLLGTAPPLGPQSV